jgi:hypothetical protein
MNDPQEDEAEYDFAPSRPVSVSPPVPPSSPRPVALSYQTSEIDPNAPADPETIKNLWMPLWLLCGGVVIEGIAVFFRRNVQEGLAQLAIGLMGGTFLTLIGVMLAARVRQINLGNFWTAVFKLAAISIAPSAVVTLLSPVLNAIPFGGLLGLVGQFILYFALLGALFDLDESDTWYCLMVIFLVNLLVYFTIRGVIAASN